MTDTYPIVGMSPGNSYFKDEEVRYLLKTIVEKYGRVGILIADIPAVSTYRALGYPANRARRDKAIPQGNALKNRVKKTMHELGYTECEVKIFDWGKEVEQNDSYQSAFKKVSELYESDLIFREAANSTTRSVLQGARQQVEDIEKATHIAVHYLLSEIAFLEFAPAYLDVAKISYVYHKNWPVYEDYIAGKFGGGLRPHMDFLLIENPYETFNPIWGLEEELSEEFRDTLERIEKTKVLRVGFVHSIPTLMYDREYNNFSGIFYEIIIAIAKKYNWKIKWTEETGYGVIAEGLKNDRFDIFGSTVWPTPERLEVGSFSLSLFASPVFTCVRADDRRSEEDLKDDENARVVIMENDITDSIAGVDFPKNRRVKVPQLTSNIERAHFVADRRGDFTFIERYLMDYFNENSGVKLVSSSETPIRVYENTFMFKRGEVAFKEFWDAELMLLKQSGAITGLIKKYTGSEQTFPTA